jgi:hypothetical protein
VFAQAPEARTLFTRVGGDNTNSGKFKAHAERVLASLDITINLLDQPEAFQAQLARLKEQHIPRNIPEKYFNVSVTIIVKPNHSSRQRCIFHDQLKVWSMLFESLIEILGK